MAVLLVGFLLLRKPFPVYIHMVSHIFILERENRQVDARVHIHTCRGRPGANVTRVNCNRAYIF